MAVVSAELDVDDDGESLPLPEDFKGITVEEGKCPAEGGGGIAGVPEDVAFFRQLKLTTGNVVTQK